MSPNDNTKVYLFSESANLVRLFSWFFATFALIPTGAYALNRLGLSTQVPANIIYITDGSARQVKFGDGKSIIFRHSNDLSNFAYQSKLMQLAVLAMREIGEKAIMESQIEKIKSIITEHVSEQDYKHDIVLAPTWIKKILQR